MTEDKAQLPAHYYDLSGPRVQAREALISRVHVRTSREERAQRAMDYTLGVYAEVMSGEDYAALLRCLQTPHPPAVVYTEPAGHTKLKKMGVRPDRLPLDPFPAVRLGWNEDPVGLDRMQAVVDRLRRGDYIAFSQSQASALPAWEIGAQQRSGSLDIPTGETTVIDLCAAPGNKTLNYLCQSPVPVKALLNDIKTARLDSMHRRLERIGFQANKRGVLSKEMPGGLATIALTNIDAADTGAIVQAANKFLGTSGANIVIADVECPGDGRLHSHPNSGFRTFPKNIAQVAPQVSVLNTALKLAKPFPLGVVCYSTCSVHPLVNEGVVAQALAGHPSARCLELEPDGDILHEPVAEFQGQSFPDVRGIRAYPPEFQHGFFCSLLVTE